MLNAATFLQSPLDVPLVARRFRATEHVEADDVPLVDRALRIHSAFGRGHHLLKLLLAVRDVTLLLAEDRRKYVVGR